MNSKAPDTSPLELIEILIVDDVASIRDLVKGTLSSAGFRNVFTAKDGHEAYHFLKSEKVSIVICDWDMPGMSGMELLHDIRSDNTFAQIPFVMLTGLVGSEEVKQAISAGVDDYICKPVQPKKLLTSIIKLIKRKGLI